MSNKIITVVTEESVRLDRYIRRIFPLVTQGMIEKALRSQRVKLNGQKSKANVRVVDQDEIMYDERVFEGKIEESKQVFSKATISLAKKLLSEYLIYSSEKFIAIDKPAGVAVQGGSKINLSIDEALKFLNQRDDEEYKIVHRLDKETSGVLLIAKGYSSASKLGAAFKDHLIQKKYLAVVSGVPSDPVGNLVHYIDKDRLGSFETVKELKEGKRAETNYKVIGCKSQISTIEFEPKTGRMHQLRFHAKYLGCPIVGDKKYGGIEHVRMMLHAKEIVIDKSVFGKVIKIKSDVPDDFDIN